MVKRVNEFIRGMFSPRRLPAQPPHSLRRFQSYLRFEELHILLYRLLIILHTLLQCFQDHRVLFGCAGQDVLLLLLKLVDGEQYLRRHVMHLGLLLQPVDDVG